MTENKNLPVKMGLQYGTILGFTVISIGIIRYRTGMILHGDQRGSYVYWCIFTLTIFYAVLRYKRKEPASFTFKKTIWIGLVAGLVSGLMYTLYIVILNYYIDPELNAKLIAFNEKENADSPNVMKMGSALRGLVYTCVCMFFGVIHSIISTIVSKKLN